MSWRLIFAILVIALGASAWGGVRLGEWLVAHGPVRPEIKTTPPELAEVPVLGADGKPFVALAPQPLVDGRLGIPEPPEPIQWELTAPTVAETQQQTPIPLATTTITMEEAIRIANANPHGLMGLADVGDLLGGAQIASLPPGSQPQGGGPQFIQPVDITTPPPPPPPPVQTPQTGGNWEAALRKELQACSRLGFFDRPSCAWAARNKYCEPNRAWGRVPDCPDKNF
ncbi:MAG TPA: hypothetical protein VKZ52_04245 [Burkholderiaceae bacterium]|nr:hypothetical protein [Burkholderiaceae bacterium]